MRFGYLRNHIDRLFTFRHPIHLVPIHSPRSFDKICQSDLRVQAKAYEEIEPNSSGRPKGQPISQLSVGQVTKFYLHVELKNKKEPAYETNLYVTVPSVLYYVQVNAASPVFACSTNP